MAPTEASKPRKKRRPKHHPFVTPEALAYALNMRGIPTDPCWTLKPCGAFFVGDDVFRMVAEVVYASEAILRALVRNETGRELEVIISTWWRDPHAPDELQGQEGLPFGETG